MRMFVPLALAALIGVSGCGNEGNAGAPSSTASGPSVAAATIETGPTPDQVAPATVAEPSPSASVTGSVGAADDASGAAADPTAPPGAVVQPEPTGVAGVDDDDVFCSAWVRYSATQQALTIAANFGGLDTVEFARLELVAAPAMVAARDEIAASLPGVLAPEGDVVLDRLVGPYARRSEHGITALRSAGLSDDELRTLEVTWLDVLRTRDPEQPVPTIPAVGDAIGEVIATAAGAYAGAVTDWVADPSLDVSAVSTPLTDSYLADHCPELAAVGQTGSI